MRTVVRFVFFTLAGIIYGCKTPSKLASAGQKSEPPMVSDTFAINTLPANSPLLVELLNSLPEEQKGVVANAEKFKLQIIYTQIDRDKTNKPFFRHHYFNVSDKYTYPASTVKLPAAVLAMEKLNRLGIDGLSLNTSMFTEPFRPGEKPVFEDKTSATGKPSVGHYVKKILLVSDNDAHNRLYEFLGQQPMNERLHGLGFEKAQMTHRLSISLSDEENRMTNPVWFMGKNGQTLYRQPYAASKMKYAERNDFLGKGFMKSGNPGETDVLVNQPMDFSIKNRWPLSHAHLLTQWIVFPESQPDTNRLLLSASDYTFLWKYMSMFPGESDFPQYPAKDYWPSYVKFLWAGSEKGSWPDSGVRIFNKVGNAYGFLMDAAYIVDFTNNIEFLLSAVIYCNKDEILNDNRYDYDDVGFPFLKALGQAVHAYEKQRTRTNVPDLSRYKMQYKE